MDTMSVNKRLMLSGAVVVTIFVVMVAVVFLTKNPDKKNNATNNLQLTGIYSPSRTRTVATVTYEVKEGDTIASIAKKYSSEMNTISEDSIKWANDISSNVPLKPGTLLTIPPVSGVFHTVVEGDDLTANATKYKVIDSSTSEETKKEKLQEIVDINLLDMKDGKAILVTGQKIIIPGGKL